MCCAAAQIRTDSLLFTTILLIPVSGTCGLGQVLNNPGSLVAVVSWLGLAEELDLAKTLLRVGWYAAIPVLKPSEV